MTKICIRCKEEKDISNFRKDKYKKDGFCPYCKDCCRCSDKEDLEKRRAKKYKKCHFCNEEKLIVEFKISDKNMPLKYCKDCYEKLENLISENKYHCKKCDTTHDLSLFYKSKTYIHGIMTPCIPCREKYFFNKKQTIGSENSILKRQGLIRCTICKQIFKIEEMHPYEKTRCNKCKKDKDKRYRLNNIKQIKEKSKIYYGSKSESIRKRTKIYYENNKEVISKKTRERYFLNKDRLLEKGKKYAKLHPEIGRRAKKKYKDNKLKNDPNFKLKEILSNQIRGRIYGKKNKKTIEYLNHTIEDLRLHIQNQFDETMSWDNFGYWHLDHIIPVSLFKLIKENGEVDLEEIKKCWDLRNLRPLNGKENCSKGNKLDMGLIKKYGIEDLLPIELLMNGGILKND